MWLKLAFFEGEEGACCAYATLVTYVQRAAAKLVLITTIAGGQRRGRQEKDEKGQKGEEKEEETQEAQESERSR